MKLIDISTPKHPNVFTQVDDDDFVQLSKWKWTALKSGQTTYASRHSPMVNGKRGKIFSMHIFIMKTPSGMYTDHIDGDGLNNQRSNLRICTASQNGMNRKKQVSESGSKFKGVYFQNGVFKSCLQKNKKSIYMGYFKTEIEAALAYNEGAKIHYGEFARLNNVNAGVKLPAHLSLPTR